MKAKRRIGVLLSVSIGLLLLWPAVPAGAIHDLEIPVDTVVRGESGDVVELITVPVETDEVGMVCEITVIGENNPSLHPNSDLIITSNGDSFVVPDVEAASEETTRGSVEVVLGESVMVEVRLGEDGIFSGGLTLTSECAPPEVEATEATTTTAPPTTVIEPEVLAEAATVPTVLPETQVQAATAAQPTFTG